MIPEKFKALLLEEHGGQVHAAVKNISFTDQEGDVVVKVDYSTLNYKDGLILAGIGRMVKQYPIVPGVDFAGKVVESKSGAFKPGDSVILTGWRYGEIYWGGYAQYARVKSECLIKCPENFDTRLAMALGTAGLTAALSVMELESHGLKPDQGPVLVTGATGGVGSISIMLLTKLGYQVAASTGKKQSYEYLMGLGASQIIDRHEFSSPPKKMLEHETWAGAIDSVGSTTLAHIITQLKTRASVAACGLAGGGDLPSNLMPFLLRGVRLIGIASADCPMEQRRKAWALLSESLSAEMLSPVIAECALGDVPKLANQMLQGQIKGRIVVNVNK